MTCRAGHALMSAANVSGIPHSFVVDSAGVVKFQGHPADPAFEQAVKQVRGGQIRGCALHCSRCCPSRSLCRLQTHRATHAGLTIPLDFQRVLHRRDGAH